MFFTLASRADVMVMCPEVHKISYPWHVFCFVLHCSHPLILLRHSCCRLVLTNWKSGKCQVELYCQVVMLLYQKGVRQSLILKRKFLSGKMIMLTKFITADSGPTPHELCFGFSVRFNRKTMPNAV